MRCGGSPRCSTWREGCPIGQGEVPLASRTAIAVYVLQQAHKVYSQTSPYRQTNQIQV